jgi:hypothetical protein
MFFKIKKSDASFKYCNLKTAPKDFRDVDCQFYNINTNIINIINNCISR